MLSGYHQSYQVDPGENGTWKLGVVRWRLTPLSQEEIPIMLTAKVIIHFNFAYFCQSFANLENIAVWDINRMQSNYIYHTILLVLIANTFVYLY